MNGFVRKLAHLAVSKAAAFSYAVAVGVAGNLIFHFVTLHGAAIGPAPPPETPAMASVEHQAPHLPAARPPTTQTPAAAAVAAPKPLHRPERSAVLPPLPEPVSGRLPGAGALPPPPLKPAILPHERPVAPAAKRPEADVALAPPEPGAPPERAAPPVSEAHPMPEPQPPAAPREAALPPAAPSADATAMADAAPSPDAISKSPALAPLGPPIDVAAPPAPRPVATVEPPAAKPHIAAPATVPRDTVHPAAEDPGGFKFSDVWHPYYSAVKKGVHWAGRQLPVIGRDDPPPRPQPVAAPVAMPAAPIPLLPPDGKLEETQAGPVKKPRNPGPGSGGLY